MTTERCMTLIDFTCPSCPYLFWRHKITFKPRREFTPHVPFLNISLALVMFIIEHFFKPRVIFLNSLRAFLASAIQYKSRYESRSVVAPIRTRTQFPAILCRKMGTLFGDNSSTDVGKHILISKLYVICDITAVSHKMFVTSIPTLQENSVLRRVIRTVECRLNFKKKLYFIYFLYTVI